MNIKQKMIEAMAGAEYSVPATHNPLPAMLDAALAVLADPANWTDDMTKIFMTSWSNNGSVNVQNVIKHIMEMPS